MKLKGLILLIVLGLFIPNVLGATESLYVNSFTSSIEEWTESGASPWIDDTNNDISESTDGNWHDFFDFANSGVGAGTINSVELRIEIQGPSARNDEADISLHNGTNWYVVAQIDSDADAYEWVNTSVSAYLYTWAGIDNAQLKVQYDRVGSPATQTIYIRRAFLYIDYSAGGNNYEREADLSLTYTWDLEREWTLLRDLTQGLTFTWDAEAFLIYVREATLGLTYTWDLEREWTLLRDLTQGLTFTWDLSREWSLTRDLTQGLTFTWDAWGDLVSLLTYTFDLNVTDSLTPIGGALVELYQGTTRMFSIETWDNGSIPTQTLSPDNYDLEITHTDHLLYENLFTLSENIDWVISLTTLNFQMALFAFIGAGLGLMLYGWKIDEPEKKVTLFVLSMIFWFASWAQWIFEYSTSNNIVLSWVFLVPVGLCVLYLYESAIEYMGKGEKDLIRF